MLFSENFNVHMLKFKHTNSINKYYIRHNNHIKTQGDYNMKARNLIVTLACLGLSVGSVFAAGTKYISLEKAKEIAKSKVVGATIESIEFEHELGRAIYDIDLILNQYEYDLKLDAITGSGISIRKELRDKFAGDLTNKGGNAVNNVVNNTANTVGNKVAISMEQAKQIALKQVQGATVTDAEFDRTGNVYEIELRKGYVKYDIEVSASTGAVIKVEIDD